MMKERRIHTKRWLTQCGKVPGALALLLIAAMLLVACTDGTQLPQQGLAPEDAITFSATDGTATRAAGETGNLEALRGSTGFGVFASYTRQWRYTTTTVSPDFLCNQRVVWTEVSPSSSTWTYTPLKYWPNGEGEATDQTQGETAHQVSFFAYAPWSDLTTTSPDSHAPANCITDCSQTYEQGDPWVLYRLAGEEGSDPTAQQVDLLYGVCDYSHYGMGDGLCNIDLTKPATNQRIPFTFRHALGTVGDKVTVSVSDDLKTALDYEVTTGGATAISLVLQSITIDYTLTSKARLMLFARDGQPNWRTVTSENVKTTRTVSQVLDPARTLYSTSGTPASSSYEWNDKGVFYIPIEGDDYVQRARITIGYSVVRTSGTGDTTYPTSGEATTSKNVVLHEQTSYGPGQKMNFNISLSSSITLKED